VSVYLPACLECALARPPLCFSSVRVFCVLCLPKALEAVLSENAASLLAQPPAGFTVGKNKCDIKTKTEHKVSGLSDSSASRGGRPGGDEESAPTPTVRKKLSSLGGSVSHASALTAAAESEIAEGGWSLLGKERERRGGGSIRLERMDVYMYVFR
jgi:hypothetical protein